jgi:ubiquinone/menaquinone biosynthesis C-methylase UbiE
MRLRRSPSPASTALGALLVGAVLIGGVASSDAQENRRVTRVFAPEKLSELEGPDRELWQKPDAIMDALGIADGSQVADIGAGGGWFTLRLARRVGPRGVVYAEDIQEQMIESIDRRMRREGLQNVRMVLGTPDDPKLPRKGLHAVLIVDVYHEVEKPVDLLKNLAESLAPQGRLGIVDFKKDGGGPGPPMDERVDEQAVINYANEAGLRLLSRETFLPYQYLLVFVK